MNSHINHQLRIWLFLLLSLIILIILVGGLTRLTDSGLSITTWELFVGFIPPLTDDKWIDYFNLYKKIPEYTEQNFSMTLSEFKVIFLVGMGSSTTRKINWLNCIVTTNLFYN